MTETKIQKAFPRVSKESLAGIKTPGVTLPGKDLFALPEKVLQFGTGVLLRGLPDYFIDKANRQGIFNGRIVVVKSTDTGDAGFFEQQDGLYTLCVRGVSGGRSIEENILSSAISRVLSAKSQWEEILRCASNPDMKVVISNTTEVGIRLVEESIGASAEQERAAVGKQGGADAGGQGQAAIAPSSFPGKLLAFLWERYRVFGGSPESGMVIIPTELIIDNGKKLAAILEELARFNKLEAGFLHWLKASNHFCSSLVDRIVPGKPAEPLLGALQHSLGYTDELLSIAEPYRLWAIEGGPEVVSALSFAKADAGVIIKPDIEIYRELKLRLLNGTHTLSCGLAFLAGFETVREAMADPLFSRYVTDLMLKEIAPSIPYATPMAEALEFGKQVLDRFRNPHLQHQWLSITMQYSSKIKMRDIPVLLQHYKTQDQPPLLFSLGFAAYLLFMKATKKEGDRYLGECGSRGAAGAGGPRDAGGIDGTNGKAYAINDERAAYYYELWQKYSSRELVAHVLRDEETWGADLSLLKGFEEKVGDLLDSMITKGVTVVLATVLV